MQNVLFRFIAEKVLYKKNTINIARVKQKSAFGGMRNEIDNTKSNWYYATL